MAVEAPPSPTLVLLPAQLLLGLFMELLNSMPAMAILHQFLQWGRGRLVTPVVLALPLLVSGGPLPQQPALSHCSIPGMPPTIQAHELLPKPALAPLPPPDGTPQAARQGSQHLVSSVCLEPDASLLFRITATCHEEQQTWEEFFHIEVYRTHLQQERFKHKIHTYIA